MTAELMSPNAFKWFLTLLTGLLAGAWFVYDSINLTRHLAKKDVDRSDGTYRDKRFGYMMGIVIGALGVWGCLRFHDVV